MAFKVLSLIGVFMVIAFSHGSILRPSFLIKLEGPETVRGITTSPTISVQRFGGSTFYNYIKSTPATEASPPPPSSSILYSKAEEQEENPTTTEPVFSSTPPVSSTDPTDNSSSGSGDEDDSDEESYEERVSTGGNEDDAELSKTTPKPVEAVPVIVDESGHTEIPVVLPQAPPASIQDTNDGVGDADAQPDAPAAVGEDGGNNGGELPSDQKPPPAEAVPGQPGEDDPDSSSSSSSESSSSSSSEEFKQAYYRKVWDYNNKIKSKESQLLRARLQSKLWKKQKTE